MTNESIQEKLEQIRQSYISTLNEKRDAINAHWCVLKESENEEAGSNMYLVIHGIAGSAETFGLPELTRQARTVLDHIKETNSKNSFTTLTTDINREIEKLIILLTKLNEL